MRCLLCESLSLTHICSTCQDTFLKPSIHKRKIFNNIEVISFYKYKDIKDLLHTKHTDLGYYIYNILAKNSFEKFAQEFTFSNTITSIAIDDNCTSGYSHTAILNQKLKSDFITPQHSKLRAKNSISYSGKSKQFRLQNPRNFVLQDFKATECVLVDDIITTGTTLIEACNLLKQSGKNILFCLTLADASL